MNKIILLSIALLLISSCNICSGEDCTDGTGAIPSECTSVQDDMCELFDCMVDFCWCKGPVLQEGTQQVTSVEEAEVVIENYIVEGEITNSVNLNDVFFNVFVDVDGEEQVYTVADDGSILETVCGV